MSLSYIRYPGVVFDHFRVILDHFQVFLDHFQASERPKKRPFSSVFSLRSDHFDLKHRLDPQKRVVWTSRYPKGTPWTSFKQFWVHLLTSKGPKTDSFSLFSCQILASKSLKSEYFDLLTLQMQTFSKNSVKMF